MELIKVIFLFLLSIGLAFGFWYLIFWFISGESNLFIWGPWIKGFYLFFAFTSTGKFIEETLK